MTDNIRLKSMKNLERAFGEIALLFSSKEEQFREVNVTQDFRDFVDNQRKSFPKVNYPFSSIFFSIAEKIEENFDVSDENLLTVQNIFRDKVLQIFHSLKDETRTSHFPAIANWFNSLNESLAATQMLLSDKEEQERKKEEFSSSLVRLNDSIIDKKIKLNSGLSQLALNVAMLNEENNKMIEWSSSSDEFSVDYQKAQNRRMKNLIFALLFRLSILKNYNENLIGVAYLNSYYQQSKVVSYSRTIEKLKKTNIDNLNLAEENVILDNKNKELERVNLQLKNEISGLSQCLDSSEEELPSYQQSNNSYFQINLLLLLNSSRSFVPFRSYGNMIDMIQGSILASRLSENSQTETFLWSSLIVFWLVSTNYVAYKILSKGFRILKHLFVFPWRKSEPSEPKQDVKDQFVSDPDSSQALV